jgi:AcrR family transcriptional regulator
LEKSSPLSSILWAVSASKTSPDRPLRRDAERNRQRIIEAARVVFAERGLRASHDDIAREAGVGVGTVYRRFPDRELLIDALFEERIEELAQAARAAAEVADPWEALSGLLVRMQELHSQDRGLKEIVLGGARGTERAAAARALLMPLIAGILQRAKDAGVVRRDVEITDLPLIQMAVGSIADSSRDVAPDLWRRTMGIVLDGLRAENATSELEPRALDEQQVAGVMASIGSGRR